MDRKTIVHLFFIVFLTSILFSCLEDRSCEYGEAIRPYFSSVGIDISHHQGEVNWEDVFGQFSDECAIHFVYLKATEGETLVDTKWYTNRNELIALDIPHGAYHFYRFEVDPKKQAQHFLANYQPRKNDLPPVLDVEIDYAEKREEMTQSILTWLQKVENLTGVRPIIYTSYYMYKDWMKDSFPDYRFWVAGYDLNYMPYILRDDQIIHWQYTDDANLINHRRIKIDLNASKIEF